MKKLYLLSTFFLFVTFYSQTVPPSGISLSENYVYTREYLSETSQSSNSLPQVQSVTYFDGLGRPKQTIHIKASPSGKDLVTRIEYDELGRQDRDFLPMPQQNTNNGTIYSPATIPYSESVGIPLYGGIAPFFSKKEIENSPLNRPLSTMAPGAWGANDKKIKFEYRLNQAGEVKRYYTQTAWSSGATVSELKLSSEYSAGQLYKNVITDEDGNVSIEFKDKQGQTVLIRKMLTATASADTYYVYNEYHDLAYVLSSLFAEKNKNAITALLTTQTDLDELCYQYRYDGRNRLVEKKLPGKGWEYMVYDKQDRLVMTQDANRRSEGSKWLFTKYDQFGRVVLTGITQNSNQSRQEKQDDANNAGANNTFRTKSTTISYSGLGIDYDVTQTFPPYADISQLLSVNYYDTYPSDMPAVSTMGFTQTFLSDNSQNSNVSTKSLPTASYIKNIEDNDWTKNYSFYDLKGRATASYTKNHLGGYTKTESVLDFSGVPKKTYTHHNRTNSTAPQVKIEETFTYDHQNRLVKHEHQVNNQAPEILAENTYNEIGQLQTKKVGNNIQEINYKYNIRGWLTQINDPANMGNDLFGYRINYNEELLGLQIPNVEYPQYAIEKKYNGNIAEVQWSFGYSMVNTYGYVYDPMNRLMAGFYQNPHDPASREYSEILGYDLNGNIRNLKRTSFKPMKGSASFLIDDLTYTYRNANQSNQINQITDATNNPSGYPGGGQAVSYDANGNMTAIPDKGITAIAYNFLNLPTQISQNNNTTNYFYRADGVKIKKKYTLVNQSGTHTINTEYLDGFQYSTGNTEPLRAALAELDESTEMAAKASQPETFSPPEERAVIGDPGNPPVDPNAVILSFFPTAEGYYDYENLRYIYQYKDHLGNVRVSYVQEASSLKVMDTNNYYPFGLSWLNPNTGQSVYDPLAIPYNYKYNGKELQETGMYDYGARMYMPDIAIFGTHDPLSEKTLQPYAYAYNNPIRFIDPTGMEGEAVNNDTSETGSGGVPGDTGRDSAGNQTVNIGYGIYVSAGTAAINVTHFGDGSGDGDDKKKNTKSNNRSQKSKSTTTVTTQTDIISENPFIKLESTSSVTQGKAGLLSMDSKITNNISTGKSTISTAIELNTIQGKGNIEVTPNSITIGGGFSLFNKTIGASVTLSKDILSSDISINASQSTGKNSTNSISGGIKPMGAVVVGATIMLQRFLPPSMSPILQTNKTIIPPKL